MFIFQCLLAFIFFTHNCVAADTEETEIINTFDALEFSDSFVETPRNTRPHALTITRKEKKQSTNTLQENFQEALINPSPRGFIEIINKNPSCGPSRANDDGDTFFALATQHNSMWPLVQLIAAYQNFLQDNFQLDAQTRKDLLAIAINQANHHGVTPLQIAVRTHNFDHVRILLDAGASANSKIGDATVFFYALSQKMYAIAQLLAYFGADLDAENSHRDLSEYQTIQAEKKHDAENTLRTIIKGNIEAQRHKHKES